MTELADISTGAVSFGKRLSMLAAEHPAKTAIIFSPVEGPEQSITYTDLDLASNRACRVLQSRGADIGRFVIIGLPNCIEHFIAALGAWKAGACTLPISYRMPARERDAMIEIASPVAVVAEWDDIPDVVSAGALTDRATPDSPVPDKIPHPGKSVGSGGSTGRPKIIVDPSPWMGVPGGVGGLVEWAGLRPGQVQLVPGPLYHNMPFSWPHLGLFQDHTIVLMERFDAERAVDLIERHRVEFLVWVPTMMRRVAQLPDIEKRDLSSIEAFMHSAAPCPPWVKRAWCDLIEPSKIREGFGATEGVGACRIRGDEWLEHPGSVGTPAGCEMRILEPSTLEEVAQGEVGEIFMRPIGVRGPTYNYVGSDPAKTTEDGFVSVGDLGWVDADGYLFLADRRVDLIISGGSNIFPAEVEAALTEHSEVADVAVIGMPDDDLGKTVHAIVQPRDSSNPPSKPDLDAHCRERLARYKCPRSYEFLAEFPRDESGKIRRSQLADERADSASNASTSA